MSESHSGELKIKTSKNPVIQGLVIKQKKLIGEELAKKHVPPVDDLLLTYAARSKVASQLKLAKRSAETKKAEELSEIDELTGLRNRRGFYRDLEVEIARANRAKREGKKAPITLLAFDFDNLKKINDLCGHGIGDEILKLTKLLYARKEEQIYRAGEKGDEFFQILNNASPEQLKQIISRHIKLIQNKSRSILREYRANNIDVPEQVTISIGLVEFTPENMSSEELIKIADEALYRSKNNGKNRATLATRITQDGIFLYRELPIKI